MISKEKFNDILQYMHNHPDEVFTLVDYVGDSVDAKYNTDYESDNGLDENDEKYEELQCIVMQKIADGTLFEINYHILPEHILCNGEEII